MYNLDQIPTSNPVAVEALILVALISLVVSHVLVDLLREIADEEAPLDGERLQRAWSTESSSLRTKANPAQR